MTTELLTALKDAATAAQTANEAAATAFTTFAADSGAQNWTCPQANTLFLAVKAAETATKNLAAALVAFANAAIADLPP